MKKIKLNKSIYIQGWGVLPEGMEFTVIKYNKRYVYVELGGNELRLSPKDVTKIY